MTGSLWGRWGRPGAPISLVLCTTVAATIILTVILVIWPFDPQPLCLPKCDNGEPPSTVVVESEDLKAIARALTDTQNLSITVKLDEEQLQGVVMAAKRLGGEISGSTRDIASGVNRVTNDVNRVVNRVTGIASDTEGIARGVNRVANSVTGIASDTRGIADGVNRVADSVTGIASDTRGIADGVNRVADSVTGIASDTRGIARGVSRVANSVTVIASDTEGIARGVSRVAGSVTGIASNTKGIASGVNRVANDVKRVASSATRIASNTKGIASGVNRVANDVNRISNKMNVVVRKGMMGTVHFAHNSPQESGEAEVSDKCNIIEKYLEKIARNLKEKIRKTEVIEQQCVLVVGHANTLGKESYNYSLSERRAKLVTECLKDKVYPKIGFETKPMGEKGNRNNLHDLDSRYRAVDVYHYSKPCRDISISSEP